MKNLDRWTSLFWLVLSIVVCIASLSLGIGTSRSPGMGFLPFCASALLGTLSLGLFVKACIKKDAAWGQKLFVAKTWKKVPLVLIALGAYVVLLPLAGYLFGTFFFMIFVLRLAGLEKWRWVLVSSAVTTGVTYFVFSVWLGVQFPRGIILT